MLYSTIFLRKPSKIFPSLLTFHRYMGGGPRTFPGGLNKWQWKRMHEKKARDKEKRLLDQEKQLYQARIRSQIRAELGAAGELPTSVNPQSQPRPNNQHTHGPLSPEEQIKALADRFMKEGAEDLWNEDDGPVKITPAKPVKNRIIGEPIDLRKLITENSENNVNGFGSLNNLSNFSKNRHFSTGVMRLGMDIMSGYNSIISMNSCSVMKSRCYSVDTRGKMRSKRLNFTRNESSESEDDSDLEEDIEGSSERRPRFGANKPRLSDGPSERRLRYPRFGANESRLSNDDDDDSDSDDDAEGKRGKVKRMMSSAALGKYDMKTTKRVPLKSLEDEDDLSRHVEAILKEVNQRSLKVEEVEEESFLSSKRFDECDISPCTVKALTASGYVQMTRVQEATLSACLEGNDVLAKAKTGTGKSVAFLLPAIETVLKASNSNKNQRVPPVHVLIICPTRELASQIAAEANVLLKYHDGIGVQTLVGGTRFKVDQKRLESDPSQIIVATPGRLLDHIENKSGFSVRLMRLKMLILDEADHLLDLGFRKDIEKILDCLPRQRQSLLFSATIPKEVRRVSQLVLKREHAYIDTVGLRGLETSVKVKQSYLVAPHEEHFQIVHHLLENHISQVADYKVVVFCTTAMMTSLMFSLFREMKLNVREIHSRKPQIARTRISEEFKASKRLILITSDVSARGMNYPDVTLVVQVGIPPDREQYIHRLGRTGREGKDGEGILLLAPWEEYFLDEIKDLPLEKCPLPRVDTNAKVKLQDSMSKIDSSVKEATYHAWLGYYNSIREIGRDKTTLVELANRFSKFIGLQNPPSLFRRTASKMGLKDIPGIRIRK